MRLLKWFFCYTKQSLISLKARKPESTKAELPIGQLVFLTSRHPLALPSASVINTVP